MITLKKLYKNNILHNISFTINKGEIIGIIGPSGSGKSTLLRCIAGITEYDQGQIVLHSDCRIGMIFQNFNIFNNMSVIQNLCYPQRKVLKRSKADAEGIAMQMLKKINMIHCFNKDPSELSGGQKQRLAIARTLCMNPSVILCDEPTSALDPENVIDVLNIIKSIASPEIAILIVSHEIRFVKTISTRMIFIDSGKIEIDASKEDFFMSTDNRRLVAFLNSMLMY